MCKRYIYAFVLAKIIYKMNLNNIQIRETKAEDFNDIMEVERLGFGYDKEARLVAELLTDKSAEPIVSLLAFYDNEAIGHILFTKAYFDGQEHQPMMHILAPLAVKPEYQQKGVGGQLIKAGLEKLRERGSTLVFVLGHKDYYPKFGFIPQATRLGYPAPYPIPDEYADYWMVQPISQKSFNIGKGKIKCCDVLNRPEHWRDEESDR